MNLDLFDILKVNSLLEKLPEPLRELWNSTMVAPKEVMDTGLMIDEEIEQAMIEMEALESVRIVTEIPKSLHTLRPKKDK